MNAGTRRSPSARSALLAVGAIIVAVIGWGALRSPGQAGSQRLAGDVLVFTAASLGESFERIAADFEAAHPGVDVAINVAGSQQLSGQIAHGAPADVFASADTVEMTKLADAGLLAAPPRIFAGNALGIAVEPGNPHGITGLKDLGRRELTVVLPADGVPAGRYARTALRRRGVEVSPVSLEVNVRAVLAKVVLGEADAGIVYRSDVVSAGDAVDVVPVADEDNVAAAYPVAVLADAPSPAAARAFADHLLTPAAQRRLAAFGFTEPPSSGATAPARNLR